LASLRLGNEFIKPYPYGDCMNRLHTCANCHHDILHHHFPSSEGDQKYDTRHYCKLCECPEFKETSRVTLRTMRL